MLPEEWDPIAAVIDNAWKGGFDEHRSASYFTLLHDYDTQEVERALHLLVRNGNPFVPAVAEIITAIESEARAGIPTWPEALAVIRRIVPRYGLRQDEGIAKLTEIHPHLASFVTTYGWTRLGQEPIDDPDRGGAVLRRLEVSYGDHVDRQEDRRRQGLAIDAVSHQRIAGPRKINAAAFLPQGTS